MATLKMLIVFALLAAVSAAFPPAGTHAVPHVDPARTGYISNTISITGHPQFSYSTYMYGITPAGQDDTIYYIDNNEDFVGARAANASQLVFAHNADVGTYVLGSAAVTPYGVAACIGDLFYVDFQGKYIPTPKAPYGCYSTPTPSSDGSMLYYFQDTNYFVAVDSQTGAFQWKVRLNGYGYGLVDTMAQDNQGNLYYGPVPTSSSQTNDLELQKIDGSNGNVLSTYQFPYNGGFYSELKYYFTVDNGNGHLYVSGSQTLVALNTDLTQLWDFENTGINATVFPAACTVALSNTTNAATVFWASSESVVALDAATGEVQWNVTIHSSNGFNQLLATGSDTLLMVTLSNAVYAYTFKGEYLWHIKLGANAVASVYALGGTVVLFSGSQLTGLTNAEIEGVTYPESGAFNLFLSGTPMLFFDTEYQKCVCNFYVGHEFNNTAACYNFGETVLQCTNYDFYTVPHGASVSITFVYDTFNVTTNSQALE